MDQYNLAVRVKEDQPSSPNMITLPSLRDIGLSPRLLTRPAYGYCTYTRNPVDDQAIHRFHEHYNSTSRRGSADSTASTLSSAGSLVSSGSSGDENSDYSPTTATDYQHPTNLWSAGTEDHDKAQELDLYQLLDLRRRAASSPLQSAAPPKIPRRKSQTTTKNSKARDRGTQHAPSGVTKPTRAKPKCNGERHCNERYTEEEAHFIIYHRVDLFQTWRDVEKAFNAQFSGPFRTEAGLQSQYYRSNLACPFIVEENLLQYPETLIGARKINPCDSSILAAKKDNDARQVGKVNGKTSGVVYINDYDNVVKPCKVRIARYAEQVVDKKYPWVGPKNMEQAKKLAADRRPYRLAWEARKAQLEAEKEIYDAEEKARREAAEEEKERLEALKRAVADGKYQLAKL